jgi:hypothetical protein
VGVGVGKAKGQVDDTNTTREINTSMDRPRWLRLIPRNERGNIWVLGSGRSSAKPFTTEIKECVALQAQYIYDTYGKFPATIPSIFLLTYKRNT